MSEATGDAPENEMAEETEGAPAAFEHPEYDPVENTDPEGPQMIRLKVDIHGQAFAEEMRPIVVKELWKAGKKYELYKKQRVDLTKLETSAKSELEAVGRTHRHAFLPDEKDPTILRYEAGGLTIEIDQEITEKIKTSETPVPPPISAAAQNVADVEPLKKGRKKKDPDAPGNIF